MGKDARHADMACIFLMKLLLIQQMLKKRVTIREEKSKKYEKEKTLESHVCGIVSCSAGNFRASAAFAAVPAKTADVQTKAADENELKLWYDEKAPDSYDGWEKWSLPLGNSGIGASVFGGITQERIQLNEKSLWSGGPSASRTNYNGGNIETTNVNGVQTKMSKVVKQIQEAFASGNTSTAESLCAKLVGVSDDAGTNGYGYYLSYGICTWIQRYHRKFR